MFDESDKVSAYVKQKNIGMKIDYSGKARQVLKNRAPQDAGTADDEPQAEELDGASRSGRARGARRKARSRDLKGGGERSLPHRKRPRE